MKSAQQGAGRRGRSKKASGVAAEKPAQSDRAAVRIISLGGLNEIGKNMTVYEYQDDMIIVDCGISFPDDEMLGIDLVIPDFSYIRENKHKLRGVFITHGHEDHIGGLPFLFKDIDVPLYSTRLTQGLIRVKMREHGIESKIKFMEITAGSKIKAGVFEVEPIRVNHSIPDAVAFAIRTPQGMIVQTGDFKIDSTPIGTQSINLTRFGELGQEGVLALLSDSTNAERPGFSMSERKVGESMETLFSKAENNRIIIATFASNIYRAQQIMDLAAKFGRKVAVSGRSMINVVSIALELGYLKIPQDLMIDIDEIGKYPPNEIVLLTTGSQGEPMSALYRMAFSDHRKVEITPYDTIIISATPIPGNEKLVSRVVNELMKLGAEVIYEKMYEVHASGHASEEELKMMLSLVRPKFFMPVHGEYRHLMKHSKLARAVGVLPENILISDIGRVNELTQDGFKYTGNVTAGSVMVDGLGVGDVGSVVMRDRKHLSEDGLIVVVATVDSGAGQIVAGPDIISRGFVYVKESEALMDEARKRCRGVLADYTFTGNRDWNNIKTKLRDELSGFFYKKTKRNPMILPILMEVKLQ